MTEKSFPALRRCVEFAERYNGMNEVAGEARTELSRRLLTERGRGNQMTTRKKPLVRIQRIPDPSWIPWYVTKCFSNVPIGVGWLHWEILWG